MAPVSPAGGDTLWDIFCLTISIGFCSLAVGFVVVVGYFWDKAYAKGFQDAMETKNSILRPGDNK